MDKQQVLRQHRYGVLLPLILQLKSACPLAGIDGINRCSHDDRKGLKTCEIQNAIRASLEDLTKMELDIAGQLQW